MQKQQDGKNDRKKTFLTTLLKQGGNKEQKPFFIPHLVVQNPPCFSNLVNNKQGGCKFFFEVFQNDPNLTTLLKQGGTV